MHETVNLVYSQMNKGNIGDQESKGIIGENGNMAFSSDHIDRLENKAIHGRQHRPEWIIITCDPNGGGSSSDTAILSAYYCEGKMIICGMELHETVKDQKSLLIRSHILALRSVPRFKDAWLVFIPENNLDDAARILINEAQRYERVHIYAVRTIRITETNCFENGGETEDGSSVSSQEKNETEGVKTVTGTKTMYTNSAYTFLASNAIWFDPDFVCSNPWAELPVRCDPLSHVSLSLSPACHAKIEDE
jgi:hypothetical protein